MMRTMKNTDPRIDAYIEDAPEYAQPILIKLRKLFHRAEPAIEENIKWGNPTFEYQGIVGGMGAFKEHVAWGFWKGNALKDPSGLFPEGGKASPFIGQVRRGLSIDLKSLRPEDLDSLPRV